MPPEDAIYRFGPYELRTRTREVYKNGTKLKLRPQPFQILQALARRPGDVVTREELRRLLWPAETFADFEHGLNTAIKELRGLLNDSAGDPRYIETLPKLGYRIIVPVAAVEPVFRAPPGKAVDAKSPATEFEGPQGHGSPDQAGLDSDRALQRQQERHRSKDRPLLEDGGVNPPLQRWRWGIAAAVAVMVIVGAAIYVQWSRTRARAQAFRGRAMLAVLPFENLTGDATQDYFSDGLTEEMIAQLGRLDPQRLGLIARTSVMHYKHSQDSLPQIGRELGVQYVLEGSVRRESNRVRISAQLIQMKDQTHLWSRQYDRELSGLLPLQGEIAQEIADEIESALGAPKSAVALTSAPSSQASNEAYDSYLKGRYFWNKRTEDGFLKAADYFQRAIAAGPNYARAYAGLADTFALMSTWEQVPASEFMPKARTAALKALQIDETLADAHTSLALIAENYDYDWQTAEKEYKRAIQLDPDYATAHQWYAECLGFEGRFEEAFAESERARQLDPLSLIIATDHGALLYYSRQYDRAIDQFHAVLEMDPNFPRGLAILSRVYLEKGRMAEALAVLEKFHTQWAENAPYWSSLVYVYGRSGRQREARYALAKLKEELHRHTYSEPRVHLLSAYIGLDRKEEAIALLQKCYEERTNALVGLKVDPIYHPLRGDPRFQDLLRRVRLAQ